MAAQKGRMIARRLDMDEHPFQTDSGVDDSPYSPKKDINSVYPKLYKEALVQKKSLRSKEEQAMLEARRWSNKPKCNKTSSRMAYQKTAEQIEEAVAMFSDALGDVSKDALLYIFERLEIIRKLKISDFVPIKADNSRECQEANLLNLSWNFINEFDQTSVSQDLVFAFLTVLVLSNAKVPALNQLKSQIRDSPFNTSALVTIYNTLNLDKLAYKQSYPKKQPPETNQFPHRPSLSKLSIAKAASQSQIVPRHETLYLKHKEKTQKVQAEKEKLLEEEVKDCTFTPKLVSKKTVLSRRQSRRVTDKRTTEERELDLCTFKPEIQTTKVRGTRATEPSGFSDTVERMKKAFREKEELRELIEKVPTGENYEKLRFSKPKPFEFLTGLKRENKTVVYVDVHIGNGKKGRIALNSDDDPRVVAQNFCKTFALGPDSLSILQELLKQQLLSAIAHSP